MAVNPYATPPGHKWDCPCSECQAARERFTASQPPLTDDLFYNDGEDQPDWNEQDLEPRDDNEMGNNDA